MDEVTPRYQIEKEFEKCKVQDIINEVEQMNYSQDASLKACRILATISALALQSHNAEILVDCLDGGICEMLVMILNKFGALSSTVSTYACQTICNMSFCSRELREFLGEIGACEVVVFATLMHIGDPDMSEYGPCAMALLAHHNITNSLRLAEAGACEGLTQIGNFGFNKNHEKSSIVAIYVCLAISQLCEATNAKQLFDSGACELVVSLLKFHVENVSFLPAGIKACCCLASLNFDHRELLGRLGACELIVQVVSKDERVSVIQDGCEAIMHLSVSPNNTSKLGDCDACGLVLRSLESKLMDRDFGSEVCTGALLNLITFGISVHENIRRLQGYNAADILRRAQINSKSSLRAREHIYHILERLNQERISEGKGTFAGVIHASDAVGYTQPLSAEVREYIEFRRITSTTGDFMDDDEFESFGSNGRHSSHARTRNDSMDRKTGVYEI